MLAHTGASYKSTSAIDVPIPYLVSLPLAGNLKLLYITPCRTQSLYRSPVTLANH